MDKYQRLFIKQMKDKIKSVTTSGQSTSEAELYRLLHSAKGTAGTIGLDDWFQTASSLLERVEAESTRVWRVSEARELLAPLAFLLLDSADESDDSGDESAIVEEAQAELPPYIGTLLIVDDDLSLLLVLKEHLERMGYMVLATPDSGRALELFYSMKPDCVVLDIVLEERSGLEILQEMQSRSEQYLIPVIMISTNRDRATRIQAYESGADDFIGKPFDVEEFAVRVKRQVSRRLKLNHLLMMDELTGAYNSTFFAQELVRHLQLQLERPEPATLTLFDLDSFRYINERFGYAEGDRLLKHFSDLVKPALGPHDIWARDRHDRFYLLQPGVGEKEATSFAHQLLERLEQDQGAGLDDYRLSFSAGILELKPGMTAASCYDGVMRIVAEAKRSRDGVMVVPERRRPVENGQAARLVEMALDAATHAKPDDRQHESSSSADTGVEPLSQAASTPPVEPSDPLMDKMDDLMLALSSRLKRHQHSESAMIEDEIDKDEIVAQDTASQPAPEVQESQPVASVPQEEIITAPVPTPPVQEAATPVNIAPQPTEQQNTATPAPAVHADTIREAEAPDGSGPRLEWVDREEKVLLNQQTAEVQQASAPPLGVNPWRLAIIDDDDLIRNMLKKRLSALQAEHELDIRAFSDGEEFFSDPWHGENAHYLLILDRMMPRMNGMEVLRRLRSSDKRNRYTVLMLTGVGDDREVADAIGAGTDDYLTKPFSMVELEARIRRLLGRMKA
ncbi:response regulator [Paenibacillus hunanensis]|uniref:GGDEF domain-containing response regulator n=1 Tax=Paenibacillus hunanensis TaxID=539262 RepID=UPI002027172F|nr:response regulator [Paenibacillus hunanensis]MCL9660852.1 response regulator [Paenibacillus hunanensis]